MNKNSEKESLTSIKVSHEQLLIKPYRSNQGSAVIFKYCNLRPEMVVEFYYFLSNK